MCKSYNCQTNDDGRNFPTLLFYANKSHFKKGKHPISLFLNLQTCDECKKKYSVSDFLSENAKNIITAQCAKLNKVIPDWKLTVLTWTDINSDDIKKLRSHIN